MKFCARHLLVPLLVTGIAVPLSAIPAAAAGPGPADRNPPALTAADGPADKDAVTVVRGGADGPATAVPVGDTRLTGYDEAGGHAVLSAGKAANGGASAAQLRPGDVIASPATPVAPHGALVKVVATRTAADGSVAVDTAPADLVDALGDAKADLRTPLTAADLKVKPLTKGGKATAGQAGGQGIRLDVDVPMPDGVKPTQGNSSALSASMELHPEMLFSYERAHWYGYAPSKAEIGMAADYGAGVKLHAEGSASYDTGHKPLHIPAAEVDVDKTVWLGPVPIVLNLKVDYFYDVSADGKITVDAEQRTDGRLEVGARYDADKGWSALTSPEPTTQGTPARIQGAATAKAGIGSHARLGLYGSVGVEADAMPYLKATATGFAEGTPPKDVKTDWGLYAGLELNGSFFARLRIFGVKVIDHSWAFPELRYERKLAGGTGQ